MVQFLSLLKDDRDYVSTLSAKHCSAQLILESLDLHNHSFSDSLWQLQPYIFALLCNI